MEEEEEEDDDYEEENLLEMGDFNVDDLYNLDAEAADNRAEQQGAKGDIATKVVSQMVSMLMYREEGHKGRLTSREQEAWWRTSFRPRTPSS